jgi:hypothetical protein
MAAEQSSPGTVTDTNVIANAVANQGSLADAGDAAFDKKVTDDAPNDTPPEPGNGNVDEPDHSPERESASDTGTDDKPSTEPEGYYADEGLEEVEPEQLQTPQGQTEMGQWVLDSLPQITVQGTQNGKTVTLQVKRAEDLPNDFDFISKRDEKIFDQNIADQTNRAYKLVEKYQTDQQTAQATQFSQQEDRDIQSDIAALQRDKLLDRFKYAPTDPKFDSDPAVQRMQEVLDYYNEQNQARWAESQRNGRLFGRLSYKDAFYLYERDHPTTTTEQKKEDTSRKAASRTIAKAGNGTEQATSRPKLRRDAGIDEIIAAYGL